MLMKNLIDDANIGYDFIYNNKRVRKHTKGKKEIPYRLQVVHQLWYGENYHEELLLIENAACHCIKFIETITVGVRTSENS